MGWTGGLPAAGHVCGRRLHPRLRRRPRAPGNIHRHSARGTGPRPRAHVLPDRGRGARRRRSQAADSEHRRRGTSPAPAGGGRRGHVTVKFLPKTRPVPRQEGQWPEAEPGRAARQPARDLPVSRARESREGRGASRAEGGRRTRHEVQRAIPSRTLCVEGSGGRRGGWPRRGHGARWGPASEAAGHSPSGRVWAPAGSAPECVGKRASGAPRGWRWFWAGSALAREGAAWRLRGAARRRGLPSVRRCPRGPRPRPSVRLCRGSRSASARA